MKNLIRFCTVAALAAGLTFAQAPGKQGRFAGGRAGHFRAMHALDLTEGQKTQAKDIFKAAREQAKPVMEQLRTAREQLSTDLKAGAPEATITQDANAIGAATAQLAVIHGKSQQQFLSILTADQKAKLDAMKERRGNRRGRAPASSGE
jgi:periplasmic protein CpxP/Spy